MSNAWIDAQERADEWPHGRGRVAKDLPNHERIVVTFGLHKLAGNDRPYWSITGDLIDTRKRGDAKYITSGAIHDEIRQHHPELAPFVALHMSDDTGAPMHAVENARYWLGLTRYQTADVRGEDGAMTKADLPYKPYVMSHLRINDAEYAQLVAGLDEYRENPAKLGEDIETRWAQRWAQESADALTLLATYVNG